MASKLLKELVKESDTSGWCTGGTMKVKHFAIVVISCLLLLTPLPAWSSRILEVEGVGPSKQAAILDAKRTAVEQVVGVFLKSRTQVKDFVVKHDEILTESTGFIKSYQVVSCTTSQGLYSCRVRVAVEPDENRIADFLRRLLAKKTFTVQVREYVEGRPLKDQSLYHSLTKELSRKGYYLVRDSRMEPFYRITANAEAGKARSRLPLEVVVLTDLKVALIDKAGLELAAFTTRDAGRCVGSGSTLDEAGMDLFRCLAPDVGRQFVHRIKDKI
jgi:hypothetical protein